MSEYFFIFSTLLVFFVCLFRYIWSVPEHLKVHAFCSSPLGCCFSLSLKANSEHFYKY